MDYEAVMRDEEQARHEPTPAQELDWSIHNDHAGGSIPEYGDEPDEEEEPYPGAGRQTTYDPDQQREIDLADDAHRRDLMGGAASDDADWYGPDSEPFG